MGTGLGGDGVYASLDNIDVTKESNQLGTRPKLTILSMFVARRKVFEIWLKHFKALECDKKSTHILWVVFPKGNRSFVLRIKEEFKNLKGYHSKTLVIDKEHKVQVGGDKRGGCWVARNQAITEGYNLSRSYVDNPNYVFLYEDDVICPPDSINRLLQYMQNKRIGQVIGRVPYRPKGRHHGKSLVWDCSPRAVVDGIYSETIYSVKYLDKQHGGVEEIGSGTFGCTLIRGDVFAKTDMINQYRGLMGPDVTYGPIIKERWQLKSLIDWSVHCKQMSETKNGVEIYA